MPVARLCAACGIERLCGCMVGATPLAFGREPSKVGHTTVAVV